MLHRLCSQQIVRPPFVPPSIRVLEMYRIINTFIETGSIQMNGIRLTKIVIFTTPYVIIFCSLLKFLKLPTHFSLKVPYTENRIDTVTNCVEKLLFQSCSSTHPTALNVHIVCHTHLDTGWVETYDEYYFRCK